MTQSVEAANVRREDAAGPQRRRLPRIARLPRALWVCVLVAIVNGLVWSVLTPAFETPDEPVQIGYVQYLAETGKLPRPITPYFYGSPEENTVMAGVPFGTTGLPSWSGTRSEALIRTLNDAKLQRADERQAGYAGGAPPLYFALEAIPYDIAGSGSFFDRVFAMRAFSALLGGLTVAFVFLFLRELLPRRRQLWTVGALAVALQPVFGFMAGSVDYDNLLWTESAALLFLLAYAFRHGLSKKVGAGIGLAVVAGVLTKGTMYGMIPGTALAICGLIYRAPAGTRRKAVVSAVVAAACFAVPFALWLFAASTMSSSSVASSTTTGLAAAPATITGQLTYLWEFYLPRLPFMHHNWFTTYPTYPLWQTYIQGLIGRFGWFEYGFPDIANWLGLAAYLAIAALAVTALVRSFAGLRRRWIEFASYIVIAGGVGLLVNAAGYRYQIQAHQPFEQTRYLFPLLPLYGAIIALAARGGGRRWAPVLGVVLVVAAFGQDLAAQFLTIGRFYT